MKIEKVNLIDAGSQIGEPIDVFICASSFEDRCCALANTLNPKLIGRTFVFKAVNLEDYVGKSAGYLIQRFQPNSEIVEVNTYDPLFGGDNMIKALSDLLGKSEGLRFLIDVTTFTHETLLIMLRLLKLYVTKDSSNKFLFAYTSAAEYSVGDLVESKWLSKGVKDVRTVLGYPGDNLPTRKTHLIILVGYEFERASKLIETLEPNSVSLGYGRSGSTAITEKNQNANEHFLRLVERVASSYASVSSFEIMCNNPLETKDVILKVARKAKAAKFNVVLAPMNNKMTTIGAALAVFACEDIQICYAPVLQYNVAGYSKSGTTCYLIDLPEIFE